MRFAHRRDAGEQLADRLSGIDATAVLALPRGGVPVAAPVANRLGLPLEVFVARKVGAPHQPEFGIGAVAEGGVAAADPETLAALRLTVADFDRLAELEQRELERRVELYRGARRLPDLEGGAVVLVDDGLATGVTALAAVKGLRALGAARVTLAVPVSSVGGARALRPVADEVVSVAYPEPFVAVGRWYRDFSPTTDAEVVALLRAGAE